MKIALITDTHFGVRNDSPVFLENQREFYEKVFFPYLEEHDITTVIHSGDVFDRRKYVNFHTLNEVRSFLFDRLAEMGITVHMFVGNHDVYYKNTNDVNSIDLLLPEYDNLLVHSYPTEVDFGGYPIMMCPWINSENFAPTMKILKKSKADLLIGHFEINGFMMHRDTAECKSGLKKEAFKHFKMVFSGHFHEPSSDGHIWYLGAPTEYTWADYDCRRGFNILDTETEELTHVRNPIPMFHRFYLDEEFEVDGDWSFLKDKIIRVIVGDGVEQKKVEFFVQQINEAGPHELEVIDNSSYHLEETAVADKEAIENEDTVSIVESYVDSVKDEMTLDAGRMKDIFKKVYVQALAMED